jgi:hypothetical protein
LLLIISIYNPTFSLKFYYFVDAELLIHLIIL